jgi:hypothetical protein
VLARQEQVACWAYRPRLDASLTGHALCQPPHQSCPHVTGIAARCYASGECGAAEDTEGEKIARLTRDYNEGHPKYGFNGDAMGGPDGAGKFFVGDKYFGYAVYAGRW